MSSPNTKSLIAGAATALFLEKGYVDTSIADIRAASGVTTGSIYHFFGNKAGIAIHIWEEAISGWKQRFDAMAPPMTPEAQIRATIISLIDWARDNPSHFRVYDEILFLTRTLEEFAPIADRVAEGHAVSSGMYEDWIARGELRPGSWPLLRALTMGPALELIRAGASLEPPAADILADAAWQTLRTG